MPYKEDGETWLDDENVFEEGMAENNPGHKKFSQYKLPKWVKHPLSHPFNGMVAHPKSYMHSAGDGLLNPLGWSIAHVACKFGDMDMLQMCSMEELNHPTYEGHLPAHYCVQHGVPWCLQWLVDKGCDTESPDASGLSPEEMIWRNPSLQNQEMEWLFQALKGEFTDKLSEKAQEFRLTKMRCNANDPLVTAKLDREMLKMRKYWYNTGDHQMTYPRPSKQEMEDKALDLPSSKVAKPKKKLQPVPAALLFPGQGSQYVGMLKDVVDRPAVKKMLQQAEVILGWDPKELCLNGPEAKLGETRYCQPIMLIAGLAALDLLQENKPEVVERPQAVAGLSSGEYTALVAAGILSFEDGLRLVQQRAEAMQRATELLPMTAASVAGLERGKVDSLCVEAKKKAKSSPAECKVASCLFPSAFTVAGNKECVEELCKLAVAKKALQARVIKTSGAWHTDLMKPAEDELTAALEEAVHKMQPPKCAVYFNVTGKKIKAGADPATFVDNLKAQLTEEVLWEQSVKSMIMDQVQDFYEVGPLKQLKSMIKRIDADAFKRTENVGV